MAKSINITLSKQSFTSVKKVGKEMGFKAFPKICNVAKSKTVHVNCGNSLPRAVLKTTGCGWAPVRTTLHTLSLVSPPVTGIIV